MKTMRNFFGILFLVGSLVSCSEKPYYEKVYSFENNEWTQRVKPKFIVEIKDINKEYKTLFSYFSKPQRSQKIY